MIFDEVNNITDNYSDTTQFPLPHFLTSLYLRHHFVKISREYLWKHHYTHK
jgi:hypothetical protein